MRPSSIIIVLLYIIGCIMAKPLCDSLEEYFKNRSYPGAGRLKKTITRICTAFDVIKYDGVDPIELLLPPNEDDDTIIKDDDDDDSEFPPEEPVTEAEPFHRFHGGFHPWGIPPGFPLRFPGSFMPGNRRHQNVKPISVKKKQNNRLTNTERQPNTTSKVPIETTTVWSTTTTSLLSTIQPTENTTSVPDEDDYDDDEDDPLLNDLADFVASVRFLSLNDTRHLGVILPERRSFTVSEGDYNSEVSHRKIDFAKPFISRKDGPEFMMKPAQPLSYYDRARNPSSKIDPNLGKYIPGDKFEPITLKPSLALEAPSDLLPEEYTLSSPQDIHTNSSALPEVFRIFSLFSCSNQKHFPGVYSDIYTECKAFHLCLPNGYGFKSATFLCPKHLRYNQQWLRCDWEENVDCSKAPKYYGSNQYFSRNYLGYLHSLHALLHGTVLQSIEMDDDVPSLNESDNQKSDMEDRSKSSTDTANSELLHRLKTAISGMS